MRYGDTESKRKVSYRQCLVVEGLSTARESTHSRHTRRSRTVSSVAESDSELLIDIYGIRPIVRELQNTIVWLSCEKAIDSSGRIGVASPAFRP
jgi:hypothetical protein